MSAAVSLPADTLAPATKARALDSTRLVVAGRGQPRVVAARAFADVLDPGDVVVVNEAATLPASIAVRDAKGRSLEARLAGPPDEDGRAWAVVFGKGDHRTPTELRPAPPKVAAGDALRAVEGPLLVEVTDVSALSPRLLRVRLRAAGTSSSAAMFAALYLAGRPVQYAHLPDPLALWDVQNVYASLPWAVELPSAGRVIDGRALARLRERGVRVVGLTHAAGLSHTGDPRIDRALPLPERFAIPSATAAAVRETRAAGKRVVAVGTSAVRALEHSARTGLREGTATTILGPRTPLRVVSALVTGLHEPGTSHHSLLGAFASQDRIAVALDLARSAGLLAHEHGDLLLLDAVRS